MIEDYKNLQKKNIKGIDVNKIYPLMRWVSGDVNNLKLASNINRNFFFVDKTILLGHMVLNNKSGEFVKYPNPQKYDTKKVDLICEYLQKIYTFGVNDIEQLKTVIINKIQNKDQLYEFANNFGLDNKERKLLGLEQIQFDKSKMKQSKQKSLF